MLKKYLFIFSFFIAFLSGCKKEEKPLYPIILTGNVININTEGAEFTSTFRNYDPEKVKEYGIVWSLNALPELENDSKYSIIGVPELETICLPIHSSLLSDVNYYVRAYIKYYDMIFYGNTVKFFSLGSKAPKLNYFIPDSAFFGDTVLLVGENFLGLEKCRIYFNKLQAKLLNFSDTVIELIVPTPGEEYFNFYNIIVSLDFNTVRYIMEKPFKLSAPAISNITGSPFSPGKSVILTGKGFIKNQTNLYLNGIKLGLSLNNTEINIISGNTFRTVLPLIKQSGKYSLSVEVAGNMSNSLQIDYIYPIVNSISPSVSVPGGTIQIKGTNLTCLPDNLYFSNNNNIDLYIPSDDLHKITITEKKDNSISAKIPEELCGKNYYLFVDYLDLNIKSFFEIKSADFSIAKPIISSVSPANANWGSTITINGENFFGFNSAFVNNMQIWGSTNSEKKIEFSVPLDAQTTDGNFKIDLTFCSDVQISKENAFTIPAPVIDSIRPINPAPGESIKIFGKNFNTNNNIIIDASVHGSNYLNQSVISFVLPGSLIDGFRNIQINTNGQNSNTVTINVKKRWTYLGELPQGIGIRPYFFTLNNKLYFGKGEGFIDNNLYVYDPIMDASEIQSNFPANLSYGFAFATSQKAYFLDFNKMYNYSPLTDSWVELFYSDLENDKSTAAGCIIDNTIYLSFGTYKNYKYSISDDLWSSLPTNNSNGNYNISSFPINGEFYIDHYYSVAYRYSPLTETWSNFLGTNLSFTENNVKNGFEFKNEGYIFSGNSFVIYNSELNNWSFSGTTNDYLFNPVSVVIGNKAYIIGNQSTYYGTLVLWEYLLDRPE